MSTIDDDDIRKLKRQKQYQDYQKYIDSQENANDKTEGEMDGKKVKLLSQDHKIESVYDRFKMNQNT